MKRIILAVLILTATASAAAFTGSPYLGPTLFVQDITNAYSNFRGTHPRLSVGYMGAIDCFYLAFEAFASPATLTLEDNHPAGEDSLKISRDYGLSFLPGILVTEDIVGYLRLGVVKSKFKDPNLTKSGGQFGIGLQTSLSGGWNLRGEYIYTAFSSVSGIEGGAPTSDEFGVGLIYKFDNS